MNKSDYPGIDITKMICAIMVISIHTQPFINYVWLDRGLGIVTRLAVPFFFVSNGFFLFDVKVDGQRIKKYLLRILLLYVIWSIVYLPFNWPIDDFVKTFIIKGVSSHLWYLPALVFAVVILFLLEKILSDEAILLISSSLFIIGAFLSTYSFISSLFVSELVFKITDYIGTRNGLFYGFFFVSIGKWIRTKTKQKQSRVHYLIMFVIGLVLLGVEGIVAVFIFHATSTILWITSPIPVYALFMLSKDIHIDMDTILIRKMSSFIYFSHYLWINLLSVFGLVEKGMIAFLIVAVTSSLVAYIVVKVSSNKSWLSYLF